MSGVLVPDDEEMIEDVPKAPGGHQAPPTRPEVVSMHLLVAAGLLVTAAVLVLLTVLAWRHYEPAILQLHALKLEGSDLPESPNLRNLRERLDSKQKKRPDWAPASSPGRDVLSMVIEGVCYLTSASTTIRPVYAEGQAG
eukprot:CAMPEP_0206008822 /NCGR_PEP_ID=MMETSP1464-20131121/8335_1 /ASSEMBLY_ACC=CAM_ASM_001124 /TAXON_ID=119497 /ORGANISM="Exanthemachrysis gayraliae, Strain RCC1523" /LENGTH=139 /DNA_ID=CAMNT_0053382385 /DNA_START=82 /DNA_END=502 /DNA_ORIENTATION=-